ncbi:MAG: shikimate kinase, partial [Christensenellaceae bacterium]|nr:shikimate kinase [Christensenellaceae bacterium]
MEYFLLGKSLSHSYSPEIHKGLGGYEYGLKNLSEAELPAFLQSGGFKGLNVTIPYKQAVIPYLAELSSAARRIGAVNTISRREDGSLLGDNTDLYGMREMLRRKGLSLRGKKVAIFGSGGTARTARALCEDEGAREILSVSRSGPVDYAVLQARHGDLDAILNTTPAGMYPNNLQRLVDLRRFPRLSAVADAIYNPGRTLLLQDAARLGIPCAGGLPMLVLQARRSAERFLGREISEEKVAATLKSVAASKANLVLVGMPGSGKSLLGGILAARLGKAFIDLDALIEQEAKMPIPEIFSRKGEGFFREMESRIIEEQSKKQGLVLATGGGAVLSEPNREARRQKAAVA